MFVVLLDFFYIATFTSMSAGSSLSRPNEAAVHDIVPLIKMADPSGLDRLDIRSWCPTAIDLIRQRFSPRAAEFLFSLPRKPAPLRDHSECTLRSCTANNTNDDDYHSSHWGMCSGSCDFQGPQTDQIVDIIQTGSIPLMSLRQATDNVIDINVARAVANSKYFAVSHVWSGGLGNPMANTLPKCQILRLYELGLDFQEKTKEERPKQLLQARQRSPHAEVLFWMDTLCIPVGNDSVRSRAINTMAHIYGTAQAIIILDHELQQTQFDENCAAANLGHLICSAWMSRCWTFQEGALAAEWFVNFGNGLYSMDRPISTSYSDQNSCKAARPEEWTNEIIRFYRLLPRFKAIDGHKTFNGSLWSENIDLFEHVWNSISTRNTTKPEDIVSIISIILGFRPRDVSSLESDRRILSILNSQKTLPIAFLHRERPTIENWNDANQWLPSTINDYPLEHCNGAMWRRSLDENFFIFETSKSPHSLEESLPCFYFSQYPMDIADTLTLVDPENRIVSEVQCLLSPLLETPTLAVCVVMGENFDKSGEWQTCSSRGPARSS